MNPSEQVDKQIANLPGWSGEIMTKLRQLIHEADHEIIEEWKRSTGVFTRNSMVCALGAFKDHVKVNFFQGASLKDPHKIINSGFESKNHRAIDFFEGDKINESALKHLISEAVNLNK